MYCLNTKLTIDSFLLNLQQPWLQLAVHLTVLAPPPDDVPPVALGHHHCFPHAVVPCHPR